ncbi:hypothetical protein WJX74_000648 [Apatococcus lobatus]|uniref:Uncharacterized protein n=1 Tax=Apatococcus lobatus TaxID=904363 RepID=A0AAW1QX18_9CHLO
MISAPSYIGLYGQPIETSTVPHPTRPRQAHSDEQSASPSTSPLGTSGNPINQPFDQNATASTLAPPSAVLAAAAPAEDHAAAPAADMAASDPHSRLAAFKQRRRLANGQSGTVQHMFSASKVFQGARPGFIFTVGQHGVGYYPDRHSPSSSVRPAPFLSPGSASPGANSRVPAGNSSAPVSASCENGKGRTLESLERQLPNGNGTAEITSDGSSLGCEGRGVGMGDSSCQLRQLGWAAAASNSASGANSSSACQQSAAHGSDACSPPNPSSNVAAATQDSHQEMPGRSCFAEPSCPADQQQLHQQPHQSQQPQAHVAMTLPLCCQDQQQPCQQPQQSQQVHMQQPQAQKAMTMPRDAAGCKASADAATPLEVSTCSQGAQPSGQDFAAGSEPNTGQDNARADAEHGTSRPRHYWGQALQYLDRSLPVEPGQRVMLLAKRDGSSVRFNLRAGKGEWVGRAPWKVEWGGGASVENPHFQRVHYCELLVRDFLMRVKSQRFPTIEKDLKMVLAHCGSLILDPASLSEVYHEMVLLERIHTNPEFCPGASLEAMTHRPLCFH